MSKVRISKQFMFEMAHALPGHDGPCRNIHGHSYELTVTITGTPNPDSTSPKYGMLIDFKDLKKIIHEAVISHFDHALLLRKDAHPELKELLQDYGSKLILVDYQPTSENMVIDFAAKIIKLLPPEISLHSLRLRETVTSFAEWFADEN